MENDVTYKCTLLTGFQTCPVLCESLARLPLPATPLPFLLSPGTVQGCAPPLVPTHSTELSGLGCATLSTCALPTESPLLCPAVARGWLCSGWTPAITSTSELPLPPSLAVQERQATVCLPIYICLYIYIYM